MIPFFRLICAQSRILSIRSLSNKTMYNALLSYPISNVAKLESRINDFFPIWTGPRRAPKSPKPVDSGSYKIWRASQLSFDLSKKLIYLIIIFDKLWTKWN